MSNDLISRSALIQSLRGNVLVDVTPHLEEAIEEQPVAYDVDKGGNMRFSEQDRADFKEALKPAVEWLQMNGCPHDKIVVQQDGAEFVSGEIGFSVEVPD